MLQQNVSPALDKCKKKKKKRKTKPGCCTKINYVTVFAFNKPNQDSLDTVDEEILAYKDFRLYKPAAHHTSCFTVRHDDIAAIM